MSKKIGIIGAGNRVTTLYIPLLKKMHLDVVGFYTTNRRHNAENVQIWSGFTFFSQLDALLDQHPDILMVAIDPDALLNLLNQLEVRKFNGILLCDTPAKFIEINESLRHVTFKVGVLEQWPYLPLEQFKRKVIDSGVIGDIVFSENDFRTFDYHGIAQLRSYHAEKIPKTITGHIHLDEMMSGISGQLAQKRNEIWDIVTLKFANSIALHKFNYEFKKSSTRSPQSIKVFGKAGSIFTQALRKKSNDTETVMLTYIDSSGTVISEDVDIWKQEDRIVKIVSSVVEWNSPDMQLTDHEVGIHLHLTTALDGNILYTYEDALLDYHLFMLARQSAQNQGMPVVLGR